MKGIRIWQQRKNIAEGSRKEEEKKNVFMR